MTLDPQVKALLDRARAANLPAIEEQSPAEARANMRRMADDIPRSEGVDTTDHPIAVDGGTITARSYRPPTDETLPVIVYFHGGGWVLGDIETHDALCRDLALASESVVLSVDYRLAPEHTYPTAAEDAYRATCWAHERAAELGGEPGELAVAGDSAGGNLATVVAMMARDRDGPPIAFQGLIYPVTDINFDTESYVENATEFGLTRTAMMWFWDHYVPSADDRRQAYAAPLRADDLSGLPPAYVLTAEHDPLRDEGEAYARALDAAGVPTVLDRFEGVHHGFFRLRAWVDQADIAIRCFAQQLDKALEG